MTISRAVVAVALCVSAIALVGARAVPVAARAESVQPNDNVRRAGHLSRGVLAVSLEVRNGEWRPDEGDGPAIPVAAFAEVGEPLQNPGPLLRVPVGTEIRVTMHNALTVPMWVYGFGAHRGYADSTQLAADGTVVMSFRATAPGLSYYAARTTNDPVRARNTDDSQLNGVIVIDPPGVTPSDRIFAITGWVTIDSMSLSGIGPNSTLVFNGLAWPHTPRVDVTQGDTVRWRFANFTDLEHPLHLHGTYFRIDAKGDGEADSIYASDDRRMAVTEVMLPGQTLSMTWSPQRSGNWLFHCHFASHVAGRASLEADRRVPPRAADADAMHQDSQMRHMSGLVIGIRVRPHGSQEPVLPVSQHIRLLVRSRANVYGEYLGYGFVRGDSPMASMRDSFSVPGPTLELVRGKRVAITIVNQAHEPAAVHWHGIELESLADGVPGWSGYGSTTIPRIMPGDSLTVRFTPPRSGTFMYHSHANEMQQISSGLYGAIIVRDSGAAPSVDERTIVFSDDGPTIKLTDAGPPVLLNGKVKPDTIEVAAGRPTRLRLIDIRTESLMRLTLENDGAPILWRVVAKDGAELPPHQIRMRPATMVIGAGEIYDVEIAPPTAGTIVLKFLAQVGDTSTTQRAIVRAH